MTTKIDVRGNHKASTIDGIEVRSKTGTGAGLSYLPYGWYFLSFYVLFFSHSFITINYNLLLLNDKR